ncbi:MAG: peptidase domain-containing ABC transporter [Hyphomicrobiaceae bacterium]|nr:peptidase domain-containing ABC transporter [Hyphomicrobiaceae bacterium]MCC0023389.1 peptidase domain-containing ABC transporter [Hyphomicrobiaceae bacterium]
MSAPATPVPEANPPVAGARALDQRLRSAFENQQEAERRRHLAFESLRNGLASGQFGGLPQDNDAGHAVLCMLEKMSWPCSVDQFARAMPHFPQQFGIIEMREVMARLGFSSTARFVSPNHIAPRDLPALLAHGKSVSLLEADAKGRIFAVDPKTARRRKIKWTRDVSLVSFAPVADSDAQAAPPKSWLNETLRRFGSEVMQLLGLTLFINLMVLATSFAVMSIYDKVIPAGAFDTLAAIGIALSMAVAFELTFRRLKSRLIGHTTGRLEYLMGTTVFSKLITLPVSMITNTPVADQISRLRQFETVRDLFSGPFVAVVLEVPFIIMFMIGLFAVAGPLGFVPLVLMIVYTVIGFLLVGPIRRQNERSGKRQREHYQQTMETVSNLRQIRSFGCEDIWLERLRQKTADASAARRKASLSQRFLSTLSTAAVPVAGASTVVTGAVLVIDGMMTVGMLIGAMIIVWRVLAPIQQLFLMFTRYTEIAQMVNQIDQMMRLPSTETVTETPMKRRFEGDVTFDRVSFRYQGANDSSLMGISFTISPGELIAIEGASGAGKTTVLRLILDLYRPQSGTIHVDGINVRQIAPTELRAAIGYVPQRPALFHGTIAQNLRLAAPGASDADLKRVCDEVGILAAIEQLPKGLDTLLDHARQETLPGGFRQALSIAQALLREPKILLLDEPAKTLDYELEQAFLNCLEQRRGRTTIIMVSHRPSHIRLADRVLNLERGAMKSFDPPEAPKMAG